SKQCWCGDNVDYDANGEGVCDMACSGDSTETCGGIYAMSVYENPDDPGYLGCYSDPADSRIFDLVDTSDDMTSAVCLANCGAYQYYGTQYSTQCWCGDNADYDANGAGECNMACSGDAGEICGGFYAMSVYENPDDSGYLGCYSDPADSRIFDLVDTSDDMTSDVCLANCGAYQYYGTQYSTQCWCGDNADYGANGAGECDMACSGDASEICGGSYSMSVYENDDPVDLSYRGCYSDPADSRIFVEAGSSDGMTAEFCATLCSDSAFYGTQYSTQCWCGDLNARYSENGEGVCDMPCSGDSEETCGGYYSMSVYAHDPAYLGCFQDSDSRIMSYSYESDSMTADACAEVCNEPYYGTQFSRECWCGATNGYDDNGFQTCDMPCTGDSDEICGGSYIMSVYQTI
ncbi:unnamed protein product, partial [Ectocarpus sp. 8 AP-2014]